MVARAFRLMLCKEVWSILDIRVLSGVTPSALVAAVAAHVPGEVGVDQYGNPSLRTDAGTIVAAESLWDTGLGVCRGQIIRCCVGESGCTTSRGQHRLGSQPG